MADEFAGDAGKEERPGGGTVAYRPNKVDEFALGSKGRKGIAERLEVTLELRAVLRFEGVEPAAADKEPVACVAEGVKQQISGQRNKTDLYAENLVPVRSMTSRYTLFSLLSNCGIPVCTLK